VLDTSAPNLARAYDYLLGGGANFAADRALAGRVLSACPRAGELLSASRTYAADSLTHIARQGGVDQYLDVGSGLPTRPSTHEVVRALRPHARVVYADRDPAVVAHATALVPPPVRVIEADLAEPEALLAALPGLIDLSLPLCLQPAARAVVGVLVRALPPGSYLVLSVGAGKSGRLPDAVAPGGFTADDVVSFLGGVDLVPPGIRQGDVLCGTGVKLARHG